MVWTIYCHVHAESGRRYVGLTTRTWQRRWSQHVSQSERLSRKGWSHFANAIRKHGKEAFKHEVLETCVTLEAANAAEQEWIEKLGTRDPAKGFNLAKGGQHTPHPIKNPWDRPEYRRNSTAASQKNWSDPARRFRVSEALRNLWLDPAYRQSRGSPDDYRKILNLYLDAPVHGPITKTTRVILLCPSCSSRHHTSAVCFYRTVKKFGSYLCPKCRRQDSSFVSAKALRTRELWASDSYRSTQSVASSSFWSKKRPDCT
jgi:hypothetical protein